MTLTRHIPNALTLGNLVCGCIGILLIRQDITYGAYLVWIACVFDFFDGFAARALNHSSPIGKELDSLADMVSFGVLPSMVMFAAMERINPASPFNYSAFVIAACSALRLAKFNIDENQKDSFVGLPTPASALFITGIVFLGTPFTAITESHYGLTIISIGIAMLMVSPLDLFALKFKNFTWADNKLRFTFVLLSVLLVSWKQAAGIPLAILLYVVLSLGEGILSRR
ncbi:MAG: CDP-diacylglycerol--serine O-phosphatidyltransferase [Cyclobacteriaceae bacterium]